MDEKGGSEGATASTVSVSVPPSGDVLPEFTPSEKYRIMRNIAILSAAFMVHFTAFQGAANLQSSLNPEAGTASLASIYAALIFSSIFLPVILINCMGCKYVVALSIVLYMPYILAQFYPEFWTLIPAGVLVGLGGGPLWCAKCTYLTVVSEQYSKLTGIPADALLVRFFGIFFMIFQFAQVWGNLISSTVFSTGDPDVREDPLTCGANFCPADHLPDDDDDSPDTRPETYLVNTVAGIYFACMVLALLIVLFAVDSLSRYDKGRKGSGTNLTGFKLLAITMKLCKEKNQILLIPITVFLGIGQGYLGADYTRSFITCAWGVSNVGYVMICYGICNSISAISTGWVVKFTGRLPVVLSAFAVNVCVLVAMLLWTPDPASSVVFFVFSGLWGVGDGVWLVQINAFCGILFPGREEAAYSNFRLWESLGFIIAYVYSPYLCTDTKIYILMAVLVVGIVLYTMIELSILRKMKTVDIEPVQISYIKKE